MSMKAVEVPEAGAEFEVVEREIPDPAADELRVDVEACGICHSDAFVKEGMMPGIEYPRVPGHEVVGVVDAVGDDVEGWSEGDRVGFGWHGGHCFQCDPCRDGDFLMCETAEITGLTFDGGYAEYMTGPAEAAAHVPESLDFDAAAPLLCAGITVYNALRHTDAAPGDLVAIQGIGGLGHLGIQYAAEAGYETVAVSGSSDKEELARDLGADHFVAAAEVEPAEALQELGGADVALATAPAADPITALVGGLGRDGELVIVGATDEPVEIPPLQLIQPRTSVRGWPSGTAPDSEDTLEFSAFADVEPMIEVFPLEEAETAYQRMIDNDVRFRSVLEMP